MFYSDQTDALGSDDDDIKNAQQPLQDRAADLPQPSVPLNALKHGLCSGFVILPEENREEFNELHHKWRREYESPTPDQLMAELIFETVQANWTYRRAQRYYDEFITRIGDTPTWSLEGHLLRQYELALRHKNTHERSFMRRYRMLESHYKSRVAQRERAQRAAQMQQARKEKPAPKPTHDLWGNKMPPVPGWDDPEIPVPQAGCTISLETGERRNMTTGETIPGPADWVPQKITPGKFGPFDPSNYYQTMKRLKEDAKRNGDPWPPEDAFLYYYSKSVSEPRV